MNGRGSVLAALGLTGWRGWALCAAVGLAVGFGAGWRLRDLQAAEAQARAVEAARASLEATLIAERARADQSQVIGERAEAAQAEIRWRTQTLIREVPVHVTPEDDGRCVVPSGFVRLHDAAARGDAEVPQPASRPDDAPSGVALSAVAETVTGNYGTCEGVRRQLIDLQAWIRAMQGDGTGQMSPGARQK